jgi:hypothetical protein
LKEKIKLRRDEEEAIITKAAAGVEKLVNGFAKGDRHARRDLILPTNLASISRPANPSTVLLLQLSVRRMKR